MTTIRCDIVSAEGEIFHGEATFVTASGEEGELGIAPRHAPLITRLKPGVVEVVQENNERLPIYVSGGVLEIQPQVVTVLADTAVRADALDETAAQQAKEEAERALADRDKLEDVAAQQAKLANAQAQLEALARLHRNLRR